MAVQRARNFFNAVKGSDTPKTMLLTMKICIFPQQLAFLSLLSILNFFAPNTTSPILVSGHLAGNSILTHFVCSIKRSLQNLLHYVQIVILLLKKIEKFPVKKNRNYQTFKTSLKGGGGTPNLVF